MKIKSYVQELKVSNIVQSSSHPSLYKIIAEALEGGFLQAERSFALPVIDAEFASRLDLNDRIRASFFAQNLTINYPEPEVINFTVDGSMITFKLELWNEKLEMWDYLFHVDLGKKND